MFKLILNTIKILFFGALFSVTAWHWLAPQAPQLAPARQKVADFAVSRMLEEIRANRGTAKTAVLLHFDNDPTNYVSNSLRQQILASGILDLQELPFADSIRGKLNLRIPTCATLQNAIDATAQSSADLLIWGQLDAFETTPDNNAIISGTFHIIDVQTMKSIYDGTITGTPNATPTTTPATQDTTPAEIPGASSAMSTVPDNSKTVPQINDELPVPMHVRCLIFALIALLLPLLTFPFLRNVAARRSNSNNALLLGIYSLIGALLAFLMIGGSFATSARTALFFTALILNAVYDLAMLSFAARLEE